jgi:hypothetical protein
MGTERRRDNRFRTASDGIWRNCTQRTVPETANILNVSVGGYLAQVRNRPAIGDAVELTVDDLILMGEVTHCSPDGEKWLAGVRIEHRLSLDQLARILNPYG